MVVLTPAGGGASGVAGATGAAGAVPTGGAGAGAGADGAGADGAGAEGAGAGADGATEASGDGTGEAPEPELPELLLVAAEVPVPQEPTGSLDGKVGSFWTD